MKMENEQLNLFDNREKKQEDETLKAVAFQFVEKNKSRIEKMLEKRDEIGALDFEELIADFLVDRVGQNAQEMRKLLINALENQGLAVSAAVKRAEIDGREGFFCERRDGKNFSDRLKSYERENIKLRKKRDMLPPQQRGIETSDLRDDEE